VQAGFGAVANVDYEAIFGPLDGEYASGHNPTKLAANLRHTPVFVASGNGVADPSVNSSPAAVVGGGAVEAEIGQQNQEFNAALVAAGVKVDYRPGMGVHDWPYWRAYMKAAIKWGLFKPVVEHPTKWTYSTIARSGRMWSLRFAFTEPPEQVATFERAGRMLRGRGLGRVRLTDLRSGCVLNLRLPFTKELPARFPVCG
jgi:hypothetical protein